MSVVSRWLTIAAALATVATASAPAAAVRRTATTRVAAPAYVSLTTWARANEFAVRWLERDRTLQLSNRNARLVFTVDPRQDSRRAEINGVEVLLAFPLLSRNGITSIAQTDLDETLRPVLSPSRNPPGKKIRTVCLDPGHGGRDPGYQVRSHDEKDYTLLLAQEVREQLKAAGFNVLLTRTSDVFVERFRRPDIARRNNADLFVSLHFNAFPSSPDVKGLEVYCCTPAGAASSNTGGEGDTRWVAGNRNDEKNMLLAYHMQHSLTKSLPIFDRGVKRARFDVLAGATMPAILIEGGFMSHPAEGKKIFDPAYRRQMARSIVEGILAYQRAVKG